MIATPRRVRLDPVKAEPYSDEKKYEEELADALAEIEAQTQRLKFPVKRPGA